MISYHIFYFLEVAVKTDDARSEDSDREKSMESLQDAIQEEMEENERMLKEKYGQVKVEENIYLHIILYVTLII